MKTTKIFSVFIFAAVILTACNKSKKVSKRLAGETWKVVELTVDGISEEELPTLMFEDCDIYDEVCIGEWETPEEAHAEFAWQVRDKGETFELSNQSTLEDAHSHGGDEHAAEEAVLQCQSFSGVYTITEHKRKEMQMESSSTLGFNGSKVVIKLERD
jgi:hypothetical protein